MPLALGGVLVAALLPVLAGCALVTGPTAGTATPAPTATSTSAQPDAGAPEPAPEVYPDGTAADNLPVFTAVTARIWASEQRVSGRAYIDALAAAGFERDAMQVTEDRSTVGNPAESLQFSVAWGDDECLIGQVGPSTGEPVTTVMPQLAEGRCLIGETRAIDW